MQIDIRGKINEKKLPYQKTLLPLFEAIVNSIQAIEEDNSIKPGLITVELKRSSQTTLDIENSIPVIENFVITDNGVGFTDENFDSFEYAHSTYKEKRGGKGIGRFTWLRAFEKAEIESVFKDNGNSLKRTFSFEPTKKGTERHTKFKLADNQSRTTSVSLLGLKSDYQKWCNNDAEDIALKIIEHCFSYFLQTNCPLIKIIDGETNFFVNDRFRLYTKGKSTEKSFKVKNDNFQFTLVRLYSTRPDNKIHYCANAREVENEKISYVIPELDTFLTDSAGKKFSIAVYINGKYLDEKVNEERTEIQFDKSENSELQFEDTITKDEIRDAIIELIQEEMKDTIGELSESRLERVKGFISKHPRYRQLLKYKSEAIRKLPTNLNDEKLEVELFKIQQKLDLEVKEEIQEVFHQFEISDDLHTFKQKYLDLYIKVIEVGNSKLAEYIIHRKFILDLLEKHITISKNGKFVTEDAVHKMIFPLKTFSDDIGFEDHNLWVIDERLSYHKYLASDIPFNKISEVQSNSKDRPDLLIFNRPFVFNDNPKPYSSIVIVEFKRPMRDEYTDKENPITQINKYAREILNGKAKDKEGRDFEVRASTPMYAYIICDLTTKLRSFASDAGYRTLPDNNGYFYFNPNYDLYVEIISFDKLISDSKQRNRVLFDKLNLS